jgi:formylglycine-generating enzyme required for sulfatase activity
MPAVEVDEWDPLPEPPTTGWEVTTVLACGLSSDPAKLIEAVRLHNPALAGRCLDEAGINLPLPLGRVPARVEGRGEGGVRSKIQQDLLADLYNPTIHLRARLQAGFILGRIGDPRFQPQEVNGAKVVIPQMVDVPAGTYLIGSKKGEEDSYDSEYPQHPVELKAFSIGKWSVTNAEYACFMEAGGYEDEKYWEGDLAERWLKGEEVGGGQSKTFLDNWRLLKDNPGWQERVKDVWSPDQIKAWEEIAEMSEEQVKEMLAIEFSQKSRSQPAFWHDRERNNPSQPVVGITWFESRAYCAWLSEVTDKPYRLPTEVEWEAAARASTPLLKGEGWGGEVRVYPWGDDWDKEKANSIEGRVMKTSPVGAYSAAGALGPFGAEDQAGNVYDWTSSLYLPYPYKPEDSEAIEADGERTVRGGSWSDDRRLVRCAYRLRLVPDNFDYDIGFRLVSPGS